MIGCIQFVDQVGKSIVEFDNVCGVALFFNHSNHYLSSKRPLSDIGLFLCVKMHPLHFKCLLLLHTFRCVIIRAFFVLMSKSLIL